MKRLLRRETAPTWHVVIAALALLVLGGAGAIQAGLAGSRFMFDLEQERPALAHNPPVVISERPYRAVHLTAASLAASASSIAARK